MGLHFFGSIPGTPSSSGNLGSYTNTYSYNNLGELTQGPLSGSGSYTYLYCNSQPHQLTGLYATGSTCSSKNNPVYTTSYDAWGNLTGRVYGNNTDTLSYDKLDHLTNWSRTITGNPTAEQEAYLYDAAGNRVLRRSFNGSATSMTVYAFGLEEYSYTGTGTNQGSLYYYYLGGHLIGSTSDGTHITFYLTDALGSVLASFSNTAGSAAVQGNQLYGPYGTNRYTAGTINTLKGFTGQYNDTLTGLDYYNARYYDPVVGVFLSADTKQGNVQGMNPYGYVKGNPETYNDPTGHIPAPPPGVGGTSGNSLDQWWAKQGQGIYGVARANFRIPGTDINSTSIARSAIQSTIEDGILNQRYPNIVALNWYIAYMLAMGIEGYRQYQSATKDVNYADAFWYITDKSGNLWGDGFLLDKPQVSAGRGSHSEVSLMRRLLGVVNSPIGGIIDQILSFLPISGAVHDLVGFTLHIVLFTQTAMCTRCVGEVSQQAQKVANFLAGIKVGLDFTTWTTDDPSNVANTNTPEYIRFPGAVWTPEDVRPDSLSAQSGFLS